MSTKTTLINRIASNGIVAAIYFVLTMASYPLAFESIQIRIAELLILLCFFRRDFIIGVTLGCMLSNFTSTLGMWDVIIGTAATLLSCILVAYATPWLWLAAIYPVVINGFIVAAELAWLLESPFWLSVLTVSIGEAIAMGVGYLVFMLIKKKKGFFDAIKANRHLNFVC